MPRAAGDSTHYEWVLRDKKTGKYILEDKIELISVTSVIKETLGKPALMPWTYYKTLDLISGAIATLGKDNPYAQEELVANIIDTFSDIDMLREWMKESRIRPEDVTKDSADKGVEFHDKLERLAKLHLTVAPEEACIQAEKLLKYDDQRAAIGQWWLDRLPSVIAAEQRVKSLVYGYAGTLDLIWVDQAGDRVITDLKNRDDGKEVYDSDRIQLDAYEIAHNERSSYDVDYKTVLVARPDGTYVEEVVVIKPGIFLDLLKVYKALN